MINQKIRYSVVYDYIKNLNTNNYSICEVGSGNFGMGRFLRKLPFTGVDTNFTDYSGSVKPFPKYMTPVKADATKNLPFSNDSFDLVVCMDVFEHIPREKRTPYIEELLRISNEAVLIGFPCGRKSLKSDLRQRNIIRFFKRKVPAWLEEHIDGEYPGEKELDIMLKRRKLKYVTFGNESIIIHNLIQYFEMFTKGTSFFDFLLPMAFLVRLSTLGRYFYRKVYIVKKKR